MADSPGSLFERLVEIMAQLRSARGCPWDREQTHTSLKPCLIEETYEVLEALESGDPAHLAEELGDLLLQVVFHAQIAAEHREFTATDVLRRLLDKLMSRHPHVFGDVTVATAGEALAQWERLKQRESVDAGRPRSVIDGVPRALPALLRAQRIQAKAARVHFDWPDPLAAWEKVKEEVQEAGAVLETGQRERIAEELGDVLFSLVNVTRLAGLDAEETLGGAIDKFRVRFADMERDLQERGRSLENAPAEELERFWASAKARERTRSSQG
jgi:tetrapyrrole methylase family protein / MazG family protein